MRRAELVEQVRRLADQTAFLAAEVRRGDVALDLLTQVRPFGYRLPEGLAADVRRVVDDMVATRHEAPEATAQASTGGSGGDATDGVSARQPTPQVGDVWVERMTGKLARIVSPGTQYALVDVGDAGVITMALEDITRRYRLVERDDKPWPPAQEPEPVGVEPATDEQIAAWERALRQPDADLPIPPSNLRKLIARFRREQARARFAIAAMRSHQSVRDAAVARAEKAEERAREAEESAQNADAIRQHWQSRAEKAEERVFTLQQGTDWAVGERETQIKRAEKAEAALARTEQVTAAERAVVKAAGKWYAGPHLHDDGNLIDLCNAVRVLRDAQEDAS